MIFFSKKEDAELQQPTIKETIEVDEKEIPL
jgi:hypothetical protein